MPNSTWTEYCLDEVAIVQGGGTPSRAEPAYFGGDLPWVTPTDLPAVGTVTVLNGTRECIKTTGLANSSAKRIPPGSVLFSTRASIGKVAITRFPCATNQGFANFTPKPGLLDVEFLAFLLARYTPEIRDLAGKTTFLEVPRGRLKQFRVCLPVLEEQQRIVSRIKDHMERIREIDILEQQTVLEVDHLPRAVRFDQWNTWHGRAEGVPLRQVVASAKNGLYKHRAHHGSGVVLLRMFNIDGATFNLARTERLEVTDREKADYAVRNGDIVVSRVNSRELVGKSALVDGLEEAAVHEAMLIRLRIDATKADAQFLVSMMNAPQFLYGLRARAKHAIGQSSINQQDLLSSTVPLPTLAEQREVVAALALADPIARDLAAEQAERAAMASGLRTAILRRAFAGEL